MKKTEKFVVNVSSALEVENGTILKIGNSDVKLVGFEAEEESTETSIDSVFVDYDGDATASIFAEDMGLMITDTDGQQLLKDTLNILRKLYYGGGEIADKTLSEHDIDDMVRGVTMVELYEGHGDAERLLKWLRR